jgi:hypothetical protein
VTIKEIISDTEGQRKLLKNTFYLLSNVGHTLSFQENVAMLLWAWQIQLRFRTAATETGEEEERNREKWKGLE